MCIAVGMCGSIIKFEYFRLSALRRIVLQYFFPPYTRSPRQLLFVIATGGAGFWRGVRRTDQSSAWWCEFDLNEFRLNLGESFLGKGHNTEAPEQEQITGFVLSTTTVEVHSWRKRSHTLEFLAPRRRLFRLTQRGLCSLLSLLYICHCYENSRNFQANF
jgi:hypothetical protein